MLLPYMLLSVLISSVATERCTTPNNEVAECISLSSCPLLLRALATKKQASIEFVQKSGCGFNGSVPLVCCGSSNSTTFESKSTTDTLKQKCTTPNNEVAECISLYYCPALIKALSTQDNASIELVRKSNCGGTVVEPMVCCGSLSNFSTPNVLAKPPSNDKNELLPDRRYCGYQHSDDYNSTMNETGISEFPWLAVLLDKKNQTMCGGSLISNRYVLTAAHCVVDRLTAVRLGEYNLKNQTDCVGEDSDWSYECSGKPQDFGIAKRIVHPQYSRGPPLNDIALLRLDRSVVYSDYIRPICLPTRETKSAEIGEILTGTGWGLSIDGREQVQTKKRILGKLISNKECLASNVGYEVYVQENTFCTRELYSGTHYACRGDSGGPVMISRRNQWHQEGLSSFGSKICASTESPEVYTKTATYVEWIKENIEP